MKSSRSLILHIPVIHRGYLDFFSKNKALFDRILILDEKFLSTLWEIKPDIASLPAETVRKFLTTFGFHNVSVFKQKDIKKIPNDSLIMINDEISRILIERYFKGKKNIIWKSVFLRWDNKSVQSSRPVRSIVSKKGFDVKLMRLAYQVGKSSSDWWRQVGAVIVKNRKVLFFVHNQGLPTSHTPYQVGAPRDFLRVGEAPELADTIHSEQYVIAEAAKKGIALNGTSIYVTHFPCPVCAKLIAKSGIKRCYFSVGSSVLDGQKMLESHNVEIIRVAI